MKCSEGYQRLESQFGAKSPKLLPWERHVHCTKQAANRRTRTVPARAGAWQAATYLNIKAKMMLYLCGTHVRGFVMKMTVEHK